MLPGSPEARMDRQRSSRSGRSVGMDRSLPTRAMGFVDAEAGIFAPVLIEEVDLPVRAAQSTPIPEANRQHGAEIVLHAGPFATVAGTGECATSTGGRRSYLGVDARLARSAPSMARLRRIPSGMSLQLELSEGADDISVHGTQGT